MNPDNDLLRVAESWERRSEVERQILEGLLAFGAFLAAMGMLFFVLHLDTVPL